jgi:hypothetical protein
VLSGREPELLPERFKELAEIVNVAATEVEYSSEDPFAR